MATMPEVAINVVTLDAVRIELKAGDVLAVMVPSALHQEQEAKLREYLRPALPEGVEVIVLSGGMTLAKISAEAPDA